jgi:transcriptional regulator EpsA
MTTTTIAPDQSEVLLRVIEAAPQVCRRHQFFVWTQGDFQRWLPHKLSLCGSYDREQRDLVFDLFNSLPMPDVVNRGLRDRRGTLVSAALSAWQRGRGQAVVVDMAPLAERDDLVEALLSLGYDRLIVHGLTRPGRADEVESLFLFGQMGGEGDDRARQALDMLLPCVHLAYQRVCVTERQMSHSRSGATLSVNGVASRPSPITEREREILVWVRDGLSNQQISEKLGISALTVKNHVQKILRKLGAANRAQAVAKAMSMNALGAANFHLGEQSV